MKIIYVVFVLKKTLIFVLPGRRLSSILRCCNLAKLWVDFVSNGFWTPHCFAFYWNACAVAYISVYCLYSHVSVYLLIFTCLGGLISGREEMGIFFEDLNANRHAEPNSFSSIFDLWGLFWAYDPAVKDVNLLDYFKIKIEEIMLFKLSFSFTIRHLLWK